MSLHVHRTQPIATDVVRISGRSDRVGVNTGMSAWGTILFGSIFVATGCFIMAIGTRVIRVDDSTVHAPYWLLTLVGAVFAIAGLFVWHLAWRIHRASRRRARAEREHPGDRARIDYGWNPHEFRAPRWRRVWPALTGAAFVTLFLVIFNYWAFFMDAPWPVVAGIVLMDIVFFFAWIETLRRIGHALSYGSSSVRFEQFPYPVEGPIVLHWAPPRGLTRASGGTFTLQCIRESFERGRGRNRSSKLVHESGFRDTLAFDRNHEFGPGEEVVLEFHLPADATGTTLDAEAPCFWELSVALEAPGLDFTERYLVPIYDDAPAADR